MEWLEVLFYLGIVCIPVGAIFFVVWKHRGDD
jgi:hypothetical protein